MSNLYNKIVKVKKLQKLGGGSALLLPKSWVNALDWTRETDLVLQLLPYEKKITLHEKISYPVTV